MQLALSDMNDLTLKKPDCPETSSEMPHRCGLLDSSRLLIVPRGEMLSTCGFGLTAPLSGLDDMGPVLGGEAADWVDLESILRAVESVPRLRWRTRRTE